MKLEEFQGGLFETLIKEEEFEEKQNLMRALVTPVREEITKSKEYAIILDLGVGVGSIDFVKIAEGMGAKGIFADNPEKLEKALKEAKNIKDRPTVIHVKVEPGRKFPPGYNSWWDVPRPQVSKREEMQKQLKDYRAMKSQQVIR